MPSLTTPSQALDGRVLRFDNIATPSGYGYQEVDWSAADDDQSIGSNGPTIVPGETTSLLLPRGMWAVQMKHGAITVNNAGPPAEIALNLYAWRDTSSAFYDYMNKFDILHVFTLVPTDTAHVQGNLVLPSDGAMNLSYSYELFTGNTADFPNFGDLIVGVYRL